MPRFTGTPIISRYRVLASLEKLVTKISGFEELLEDLRSVDLDFREVEIRLPDDEIFDIWCGRSAWQGVAVGLSLISLEAEAEHSNLADSGRFLIKFSKFSRVIGCLVKDSAFGSNTAA